MAVKRPDRRALKNFFPDCWHKNFFMQTERDIRFAVFYKRPVGKRDFKGIQLEIPFNRNGDVTDCKFIAVNHFSREILINYDP